RADRDGRVVHGGQVAHRELAVGHQAEDQDAGHDQRGHDGAADEEAGDVHDALGRALSPGALIWTLAPWRSRSWPSVTTRSPGWIPPLTMARSPAVRSTCTALVAAELSGWMTNTKLPCWPETTADAGTTSASRCTYSRSRTFTNSPGQSAPSALGKLPLSRIVPVAVSTALSTNVSLPSLLGPPAAGA